MPNFIVRSVITQDAQVVKDSLDTKYQRLADFTITLIGKTMAGKSTIREADGGSAAKFLDLLSARRGAHKS
jgi:hypothetical protein